jgi:hypothetical protein
MQKLSLFLICVLVFSLSCRQKTKEKKITEGIIEYDIKYLDQKQAELYGFLLPEKMQIIFKGSRLKTTFPGLSGNFNFTLIANTTTDSLIGLFDIMKKKYYYIENGADSSVFYSAIPGLQVEELETTEEIAGYVCKKANITSHSEEMNNFPVFYTNQIDIPEPNKNTPFFNINGVLMDFQMKMYNLHMHFRTDQITICEIDATTFKVPPEYKRINREGVKKIINILE